MATLTVITHGGEQRELEARTGQSVMEIMRNNGIDELVALCGGCCSCATCHVYVDSALAAELSEVSPDEHQLLDGSEHRLATSRLACQIPFEDCLDGLVVILAPAD